MKFEQWQNFAAECVGPEYKKGVSDGLLLALEVLDATDDLAKVGALLNKHYVAVRDEIDKTAEGAK